MEALRNIFGATSDNQIANLMVKNYLEMNGFVDETASEVVSDDNSSIKPRFKFSNPFPKSSVELLKDFYSSILENKEINDIMEMFDKIYADYRDTEEVIFLAFWFPYIKSKEEIAFQLLQKVGIIICDGQEITDISNNTYSSAILNTYAFKIATSNELNEDFVGLILDQGKIKIPIELILEKLVLNKLDFVERAFKGGNNVTISSRVLINITAEQLSLNNHFQGISRVNRKNSSNRGLIKIRSGLSSSSHITFDQENIKGKEITTFLEKKTGKLTITKLLVFASIILFYYRVRKDLQSIPFEDEDVEYLIKAICLFDYKEKKFSSQILQGLYLIKRKKLVKELLEANYLAIDLTVFKSFIEYRDMKLAIEFYRLYSGLKIYNNELLHNLIIHLLSEEIQYIEICLYFLRQFYKNGYLSMNSTKLFLKILEDLLQINSPDNEIIKKIANPLKIFVLVAEVLRNLGQKYPLLEYTITRLKDKCLELSNELQNLIEEDSVYREIILEKDLSNRVLLDIICDNNFLILLKNKLTEKVVDDLWEGFYNIQGSFFETSYNYQALVANASTKDYDVYTKSRKSLADYNEANYKCNFTHFKVWRKNIYVKFYVDLVFTLFLLFSFQLMALYILDQWNTMMQLDLVTAEKLGASINLFVYGNESGNNSTFTQNYIKLSSKCNTSFLDAVDQSVISDSQPIFLTIYSNMNGVNNWSSVLFGFMKIFLLLPVSYILRFIFSYKLKSPDYGMTLLSDVLLFFASLFMTIFWKREDITNLFSLVTNLSLQQVQCFEYLKNFDSVIQSIKSDPYSSELMLISIFCVLLWVRLALMIRGTQTFGPIIVIFFLSLNGVSTYLILFIIVTLAYASFAILNFYMIDAYFYRNIYYSLFYYIIVSLGGDPVFSSYTQSASIHAYIPWLGSVVILIVVIVNSIVLFNIVVALLTNIYEKYNTYSMQLFVQKKIQIRRRFCSDDPRFDSLLANIYPFDIFTLPIAILFLFFKSEKITNCLNNTILRINFSIYAFFYIFFYLICTALFIPLSYLKVVSSKLIQLFVSDIQQYFFLFKIFSFIFYIIFGLCFHIFYYFNDVIVFIKELGKERIPLLKENDCYGKYSIKVSLLKLILLVTHDFCEGNAVKIHAEKFFEILLKAVDLEAENYDEIKEMVKNFNLNNFPKQIKEDFNIYNNRFIELFEKKAIIYQDLCDFLSNFWDEQNIIDVNILKNILTITWKNSKLSIFFKKISDKSFVFKPIKNQKKISNHMTSFMRNSQKKITMSVQGMESSLKGVNIHLLQEGHTYSNLNNDNNIKFQSENDLQILNKVSGNRINAEMSNLNKKSNFFTALLKKKALAEIVFLNLIKNKSQKLKILQQRKDSLISPIVPRSILYLLLTGLKEYQSDISKRISENLIKNQKYLQDIHGDRIMAREIEKGEKGPGSNLKKAKREEININTNNSNSILHRISPAIIKSANSPDNFKLDSTGNFNDTKRESLTKHSAKYTGLKFSPEAHNLEEIPECVPAKSLQTFASPESKASRKGIFRKFWEKREAKWQTNDSERNQNNQQDQLITLYEGTLESDRTKQASFRGNKNELRRLIGNGLSEEEFNNLKSQVMGIEQRVDKIDKNIEELLSISKLLYENMKCKNKD